MIKSFKQKWLKSYYDDDDRSRLPYRMELKISVILADLDLARLIDDMKRPNYRLRPLEGDLKAFHTVRVRGDCRMNFRFKDGDAFDVELVDYY